MDLRISYPHFFNSSFSQQEQALAHTIFVAQTNVMEQLRFNPFNQVHKGLRALLYHTALTLQQSDLTAAADRQEVVRLVEEVIYLFEGHAHIEDEMLFPLIAEVAPHIIEDFEQQHVRDHELGEQLAAALADLKRADTELEQRKAGIALSLVFRDFTAFNLTHMNGEETVVNEALWKTYSDEELLGHVMKVVASIPPQKNMRYSYWMLKGLSQEELNWWFGGMKATAPAPVFGAMMELAQEALTPERFAGIKRSLTPQTVA